MSSAERDEWDAQLAANPALQDAWNRFQRSIASAAEQMIDGDDPDFERVRRSVKDVLGAAGTNQSRH